MPKMPEKNDEKDFGPKVKAFYEKNEELKTLGKEVTPLKTDLSETLMKIGTKDNDKGHVTKEVLVEGDKYVATNTCRVSKNLSVHAVEAVRKAYPKRTDFLETTTVVREDRIIEAIEKGEIDVSKIQDVFTFKETYAFTVKKK